MCKVLIVEDDFMIADNLEMILVDAGYRVIGIARDLAEAIALAHHDPPGLAIIDLRLAGGEYGTAIGAALCVMGGVGVLYATGNPDHALLADAQGIGVVGKPYTPDGMLSALGNVRRIMLHPDHLPVQRKGFTLLRQARPGPGSDQPRPPQ